MISKKHLAMGAIVVLAATTVYFGYEVMTIRSNVRKIVTADTSTAKGSINTGLAYPASIFPASWVTK